MSCPRTRRRPLAPAATVIKAACSCLAMAAQVVQEAPGGGDGAGGAVDGLEGDTGRGAGQAGNCRGVIGDGLPVSSTTRVPGGMCTRKSSGSPGSVLMSSSSHQAEGASPM
jgi:hypothetical protein